MLPPSHRLAVSTLLWGRETRLREREMWPLYSVVCSFYGIQFRTTFWLASCCAVCHRFCGASTTRRRSRVSRPSKGENIEGTAPPGHRKCQEILFVFFCSIVIARVCHLERSIQNSWCVSGYGSTCLYVSECWYCRYVDVHLYHSSLHVLGNDQYMVCTLRIHPSPCQLNVSQRLPLRRVRGTTLSIAQQVVSLVSSSIFLSFRGDALCSL